MAEARTSTSTTTDGSPISNLAPDHLFSILLLLPFDSIVCFSMTCKKLRTLACSDALWESICRRDWGPTLVDALKSSYYREGEFPWMKIYNHVLHLDSVACHNLSETGGGEMVLPSPRASHSLNFVSDCLVLFGGGCEGGRHLDDTWVAYIGQDFRRRLRWQRVNSGSPSGRFGHTCVVIGDFLVLFGGINDHGNRQNDTWVGQVAGHETLGITLLWRLLDVDSIVPPARGAHAACCIDDRKMVVYGGIGLYGVRLGDTWVLELSENFCLGRWHEVVTQPSPPARSGHSLTCIGGSLAVLFGGRGLGYEVLNDVWLLDLSEGNGTWVELFYELSDIPDGVCLPRVGHSANLVLGGRLLIHGGEDSCRNRKNDFWVLDIKAIPSIRFQPIEGKSWKRLNSKGYKPNGRSFHRTCADHSGRYLYVYGGMMDGLIQPAESSGLRFDGELFLAELMLRL
ncbi:F-box/kelch-repeat protein At1g51550-like [Eucalyptus grandis]|uniref:Uncharacterized protein n=2 Tax=Eucalyptus grandis TaxID=71139 RepID=A0ACC3JCE8_EUCGR|nr:F-box/kelch-repeat protein At1g51550-like [Eucalyptus grandis]KAK3411190.1 hypothetical protein EUGRSUZ_J03167 [Eucalyptus grandis]